MQIRVLFLLIAFLLSHIIYGQTLKPCNTIKCVHNEWVTRFQQRLPIEYSLRSSLTLYFPIKIFISSKVHSQSGTISPQKLMDEICHLNQLYKQANISFYLESQPTILSSTTYEGIETELELGQLLQSYKSANAIPVYIVENALDACGFNVIHQGINKGIVLSSECYKVKGALLAHEIGHFLGLPHTFQGWEGKAFDYTLKAPENWENVKVERADGSNCRSAGDGFCDTAPDYLSLRWSCSDSSKSPIPLVDPMGKSFFSDGSLIMGYALDPCPNRFSKEQIMTMRAYADEFYKTLFKGDLPVKINQTMPIVNAPMENSQVNLSNGVNFSWEKVPGTYKYIIEVSPMPNMALVTSRYEISSDSLSFMTKQLITGRKYFWRLRSLNLYSFCSTVSKIYSFSTVLATSTKDLKDNDNSIIINNPISLSEGLSLNLTEEKFPIQLILLNNSGQTIFQKNYAQNVGHTNLSISVSAFPPGQYTLTVRSAQKTQSHSVVIMP